MGLTSIIVKDWPSLLVGNKDIKLKYSAQVHRGSLTCSVVHTLALTHEKLCIWPIMSLC